MRRLALPALLAAVALASTAAPAVAQNPFPGIGNGQTDPCDLSPGERRQALENLPPDIEQYAPDLADQLRQGCGRGSSTGQRGSSSGDGDASGGGGGVGGEPPPGSPGSPTPAPPAPPAPEVSGSDYVAPAVSARPSGSQVPGWLAAVLIALAALGLLAALAARFGGVLPGDLLRPLRASFAEVGERLRGGSR